MFLMSLFSDHGVFPLAKKDQWCYNVYASIFNKNEMEWIECFV